ncbi:hypothetical protein PHLGIDRAFT_121031 [Phlebiopsis gigantea 11061_1 CR5-6]|uniref:Oxysterol-binding protein n=1 Tax=Phlebiopsis gigantea (strain 11061_1 CR5-6) TaxID=745531 RepID=A0A0C3RTK0_PHLG1|nr:hypothetical protein PHLGIDRAFT_121031 [Phlebiopsis gigantea 11061_1 CR5-6]
MMGLFSQATSKIQRPRGASSLEDKMPEDTDPDDTSILDEQEGSVISSMISQLRVGMDLHKVTFPTFVLEPRSMLERITDFMSHPDLIFGAESCDDPEERFLRVLQYYLAGWHIKPKGVKKPYNPVLGEFFRCRYDYPDGSKGFYIAEQVSHHPPVSAFYYISPANKLAILGELRPKSKFLGNSVSTVMEGENRILLMGRPDDGEYVISMPNMYARGILWGKMVLELGDTCTARNDRLGLLADLQFKTKGYFSGTYNAIAGKVRRTTNNTDLGEISGKWSSVMEYKPVKGNKRTLFDVAKDGQKIAPKWVAPEEEQEPNESRRLWSKLTAAIVAKDMDRATEAKSAVEESQREQRRIREENAESHVSRFFQQTKEGRWIPKFIVPSDPVAAENAVQEWIWSPLSQPTA